MRNVTTAPVVSFTVLVWIFVGIGSCFDRQFWLALLLGLMENLVILEAGGWPRFSRVPHPCGFQRADSDFRFVILPSVRSSAVSLSHQTTKSPPTPSNC